MYFHNQQRQAEDAHECQADHHRKCAQLLPWADSVVLLILMTAFRNIDRRGRRSSCSSRIVVVMAAWIEAAVLTHPRTEVCAIARRILSAWGLSLKVEDFGLVACVFGGGICILNAIAPREY